LKLISEFLGGFRDISRAEISGLLSSYGGEVLGESEKFLFFSTKHPHLISSRVAFSKRIGRVIGDEEPIDLEPNKKYAIKEKKEKGKDSLIDELAKRIKGRVDLDHPDVIFYIYNLGEPLFVEMIYERRMSNLLDQRYGTKPMNHPSSISPILARGMLNVAGLKEGEKFIDPFAGTGTYLIEGFRMGIQGFGIDRSWKMVEGGNKNLKHFDFPENIRQGDFSELASVRDISAIVTDPPYGRGAKIFSQSRDSLYSRFFSLITNVEGKKVFCIPSEELLNVAKEFVELKLVGKIRVHSSLTRYIAVSG
jgi:tRNA (guanine10-N2)-dimethyltransferase